MYSAVWWKCTSRSNIPMCLIGSIGAPCTLKPMIPKIIVLTLAVTLCDSDTSTCIPSCYFSYWSRRGYPDSMDQDRKVPVIFVQKLFSRGRNWSDIVFVFIRGGTVSRSLLQNRLTSRYLLCTFSVLQYGQAHHLLLSLVGTDFSKHHGFTWQEGVGVGRVLWWISYF